MMGEAGTGLVPEKVVDGCTEPLVLRPPVGSEVFSSGVGFRGDPARRKRLLVLYGFLILFTVAIVIGLLFAILVLGFGPLASDTMRPPRQQSALFRILIPDTKSSLLERIGFGHNLLNVTITGAPGVRTVRIVHLLSDGLTVIRTDDRCYIRPTRAEIIRARDDGYLKRLEHDHIHGTLNAVVDDESWFIEPSGPVPPLIENSLIMAICEGVPAFRLVSRPPKEYFFSLLDPDTNEVTSGNSRVSGPVPPVDDDTESNVETFLHSPVLSPMQESDFDEFIKRHGRSVRHADAVSMKPNEVPTKHGTSARTECHVVAKVFEGALPFKEPGTTHLTQDSIRECTPTT
ncbi:unnamed protein product [Calicophoron daubneyi]|uniref:Uncharacterized protein n=1 Tax=Calicophoron daubneyi TaxID=300641 RepID=A0AAV2T7Q6_CALDB